jgi:hypothetical protein
MNWAVGLRDPNNLADVTSDPHLEHSAIQVSELTSLGKSIRHHQLKYRVSHVKCSTGESHD